MGYLLARRVCITAGKARVMHTGPMAKFFDLTGAASDHQRDLERARAHVEVLSELAHDPEIAPADSPRDAALFAALHLMQAEVRRLEQLQGPKL